MMPSQYREIDVLTAREWVASSLHEGSGLAEQVLQKLGGACRAFLLGDPADPFAPLSNRGGVMSLGVSQYIASQFLSVLSTSGMRTLVVEDDLARRGDSNLSGDMAFLEERVVRWASLGSGAVSSVRLLSEGSSGYPLNAFVLRSSAEEVGIEPGKDISSHIAEIALQVSVVIVAAFDAEGFVALLLKATD